MPSADPDCLRHSGGLWSPRSGKQEVPTFDRLSPMGPPYLEGKIWNQWLAAKQNMQRDVERCLCSQEEIIVRLLKDAPIPPPAENQPGRTFIAEMDVVDIADGEVWAAPVEMPDFPKISSVPVPPALPGAPTEPPPTVAFPSDEEETTGQRKQSQRERKGAEADAEEVEEKPKKKLTFFDIFSDRIERYMATFKSKGEPERRGRLAEIERSPGFNALCPGVILLDAGYTTWSANRSAASPTLGTTPAMQVIELAFTCFYLSELILKLVVHRKHLFYNANAYWNWFDFILVLQSLVDVVLTYVVAANGGSATFMRLLRLVKLGKILRLFRAVRFLRDLSVMILAIMNCMSALFWAFVVLALVLYVFALMMVQSMTGYVQDNDDIDDATREKVNRFFASVQSAIMGLFMCATGGINWIDMYEVVELGGGFVSVAFVFFVGFFGFAVITILSGIFIEKALAASQPDRESMALEQRRQEDQESSEMKDLLLSMDADGSGALTLQEFTEASEDIFVKSYLRSLGLDIHDAVMFFNLLTSLSGTEELPLEDFLKKLGRMKGTATAMDLQSLMFEVSILRRQNEAVITGLGLQCTKFGGP